MTPRAWILTLFASLLALGALSGIADAQGSLEVEVLQEDNPIALDPEDTYVSEQQDPEDADEEDGIPMRSEESPDGHTAYLISPSSAGGAGIENAVADRYRHGDLLNATLTLEYQFGCQGSEGTLSVRSIETRHWDPRSVEYNDTTLAREDASVDVKGPVMGQASVGIDAGNCSRADIDLDTSLLEPMLEGDKGGLAVLWDGGHTIQMQSLESPSGPRLHVGFETNRAEVVDVSLGDRPVVVEPGNPFTVHATVNGTQHVPEGGVVARVTNETGTQIQQSTLEHEGGDVWVSEQDAPRMQGRFNVTVESEDARDWTHVNRSKGVDLVADDEAPRLNRTLLDGRGEDNVTTVDQFDQVPLEATIEDLSCLAGAAPCGSWTLTWGDPKDPLARFNGSLVPGEEEHGLIQETLPVSRPGDATARLTVEDPLGHANETTWRLVANDARPPDARPLEGSWLAPNLSSTVKEEQAIPIRLDVLDDLPVNASLFFTGTRLEERPLPTLVDEARIDEEVPPPPAGNYSVHLRLDDGTHATELAWGTLTVTPAQGPAIHLDPVDRRIHPSSPVTARLFDRNLDLDATRVEATADGEPLSPHVTRQGTEDGGTVTITIAGLEHGRTVDVTVRAQDHAGHATTTSATFHVDREPPRLLEPENGSWHQPGASVSVDAMDPGEGTPTIVAVTGAQNLTLDAGSSVPLSSLVPEEEGLHEVFFELEDDLGNRARVERPIGVDGTPPTIDATLDEGGLVVEARDAQSNVTILDVATAVNRRSLSNASLVEQSPGVHRVVGLDELSRGDLVSVVVEAEDAAGNTAQLGSREAPRTFEYPGQPPGLELERSSSVLGDQASVRWEAWDPEGLPVDVSVTLTVTGPNGDTSRLENLSASGEHSFAPDEEGRHVVEAIAHAGERSANETVAFYLSPGGEGTTFTGPPGRSSPGEPVEVKLVPPAEPDQVYVHATDEEGVQHQASVEWDGEELVAVFEDLPEGEHEVEAVLVHEPGVVEEVQMGSVTIASTWSETLKESSDLLLLLLVLGGMVGVAYAWHRVRTSEDRGQGG